jgi:hypothetical protein
MDLIERMADDLARKALALELQTGNDRIADTVAKAIGVSSATLQEAFMTALRIRRAAARGEDAIRDAREEAIKSGLIFTDTSEAPEVVTDRWEEI